MKFTSPIHPVGGIVLAAGRSTRMGSPKSLLELDGRSFLDVCLSALRRGGCESVVVVLARAGDGAPQAAARARVAGAAVVWNETGTSEQVDSLRLGLEALETDEDEGRSSAGPLAGAVILPVDHPLVSAETVRTLLSEAADRPGCIIRPVHDGQPGHPTVFPRSVWEALRDPALPRGARSVVESSETQTVDVEVDDPGVVADIDTPEAYRRHVGNAP